MGDENPTQLVRAPEIRKAFVGDLFLERVPQIHDLIARRAYEFFESSGPIHGHDLEDWFHAESEIRKAFVGDLFLERVQEIHDLIARRAYEFFESSGLTHGHDLEDWFHAESEILHTIRLDVTETQTELIVCAEVPGFSEKDLQVRGEPRRLFITGERKEESERKQGKTVYSERQSNQIFRVLDLPAKINGVKATLSNGLLEVTLSKVERGKEIPVLTKAKAA